MDRIKLIAYKLTFFSVALYIVYKISMKKTQHD